MSDFRDQLLVLLADRHSAEARAFFTWLLKYVERRVGSVGSRLYSDLLHPSELEEVTAEAMVQLVGGSLARFRGESMNELVAYVRVVADRAVCHRVRRRLLERRTLDERGEELSYAWSARLLDPFDAIRQIPDCPLDSKDMGYLVELLQAGSKGELARRQGVSRAAVTQRVQRIQARIQALGPRERAAAEAWLQHSARQVLECEPTPPPELAAKAAS